MLERLLFEPLNRTENVSKPSLAQERLQAPASQSQFFDQAIAFLPVVDMFDSNCGTNCLKIFRGKLSSQGTLRDVRSCKQHHVWEWDTCPAQRIDRPQRSLADS